MGEKKKKKRNGCPGWLRWIVQFAWVQWGREIAQYVLFTKDSVCCCGEESHWRIALPRTSISMTILYSFYSILTVFSIVPQQTMQSPSLVLSNILWQLLLYSVFHSTVQQFKTLLLINVADTFLPEDFILKVQSEFISPEIYLFIY